MRTILLLFVFSFSLSLFANSAQKKWEGELLSIDSMYEGSAASAQIDLLLDFVRMHANDSMAKEAAYRRMGIVYQLIGNYESSLFYQLRALDLANKQEKALSRASSLNNIASLYYAMGDLDQSQRYFLEAYRLFGTLVDEKPHARKGQSDLALNLASINLENKKWAEAHHFLDLAFLHLREFGDTSEISYLYLLGAQLAEAEGDSKEWLNQLKLLDGFLVQNTDSYTQLLGYQQWASYYEEQGAMDSIPLYLKKALSLAFALENAESIRESAKNLSSYFEMQGDSLQAYQYLKIYQVFNDSLLDAGRIKAMIETEQKFQNQEKTLALERQQAALKRRQFQLVFMGSLCLLLFVLSVLLVQNRNKTKRLAERDIQLKDSRIKELMQEQELKSIDAMLKGQDEERRRIARDLHDRLGSILSTVKLHFSTMEEEIRKLQEKQNTSYELATQLLDEAVDEVRKISHDLHSGTITKFGLKHAVEELISAIQGKSGIEIHYIDNHIDAEMVANFEVELYRIIQELLSNTLKHAAASEVNIQLMGAEGFITFSYEDNGKGMDRTLLKNEQGLGLLSIENRVQKINGRSTLDSRPGHGFTYIIEIPV